MIVGSVPWAVGDSPAALSFVLRPRFELGTTASKAVMISISPPERSEVKKKTFPYSFFAERTLVSALKDTGAYDEA